MDRTVGGSNMKDTVLEIRERCACDGGSAALEDLFAQYRPLVASICRRYLHAESDADPSMAGKFPCKSRPPQRLMDSDR